MKTTYQAAQRKESAPVGAFRTKRTRPIIPGETVYLDSNALLDPVAMGSAARFGWSFMRRPEGSRSALVQANSSRASFTPDTAGRYLVRLEVRTSTGSMRFVKEVRVGRDETTPVAVAKSESSLVMSGAPIRLTGAYSENPIAGSLSYEWRITAAPSGSIATLSYAASETPMIFPDQEGRYEVSLTVRNAAGMGTTDVVAINVVAPEALTNLTEVSAAEGPGAINFGRTYSAAELNALRRAVRVTLTPSSADHQPRHQEPGADGQRPCAEEARTVVSSRYGSLIGHIRMLLREGVDSIARQVESSHDFQQPAVSRR